MRGHLYLTKVSKMNSNDISRARRFNRAVTSALSLLDDSFLGLGRPLGVARVLNAIGHGTHDIATLRDYLRIDSGLLSRLLRRLEEEDLIYIEKHATDGRRRLACLTSAGKAAFAEYEALSNEQAIGLLQGHRRQEELLHAMDLIATTLSAHQTQIEAVDPRTPQALTCLTAYYAELNNRLNGGFDVNLSRDPDAADMMSPRGTFLVACCDGAHLGCVGVKRAGDDWAEIKRLWVAPDARGTGLAQRLMEEAETAALSLGIKTLRLDTNSALPEAARFYDRLGWQRIPRFNDDPYPDIFFEKEIASG